MTFRVGQKVVCVDDAYRVGWKRRGWFERFRKFVRLAHNLNAGDIYIVTATSSLKDDETTEVFEILYLDAAWHFGHRDIGFPSFQFRPIVETKTDISIFKKMLQPKRVDA